MIILAERLSQALGENLVCIVRTALIPRTGLGVVHSGLAELTTEVCRVVRDSVTIFDERVDLLWRPWLALFMKFTELVELRRGELRLPAAAEAGMKSLDTATIP